MNIPDSTLDKSLFWNSLFRAESIAVIGARDTVGTWGYDAMKAVADSAGAKSGRKAYPVNPNAKEVLGLPAYKSILDIAGPVELAIIVIPSTGVPDVIRQCVQKGVKAAVIVSAGFAESDAEGAKLEAEVVEVALSGGLRLIGPNCIGHADLNGGVSSAAVASMAAPGPMALISQSGTLGASIMQIAAGMGVGISKFISTGNEANTRLEDCLEFLGQDPDTRVIAAYIEGLREARRFFDLAKKITPNKPVVVMKSGSTEGASRAARSHTGALSGSDVIYGAAFRQAGVIRADDEEELCGTALALLNQPLPGGNRIAIITIGGGFGVVTAEICEKEGLNITSLEPATLKKLDAVLPPRWSHGNPIDLVGIRPGAGDTTIMACLNALMEDNNVDSVISLLPPMVTVHGPIRDFAPEKMREMQAEIRKSMEQLSQNLQQYDKPLIFIRRITFQAAGAANMVTETYSGRKIPEYTHPRRAARVLRNLAWSRRYLDSIRK